MTLALLGVFVMQLYYIKESYKLKSQVFEQNVNQALNNVVNKVQKRNVAKHINNKDFELKAQQEKALRNQTDSIVAFRVRFKENESLRKIKQQQQIVDYLNFQDSLIKASYISPLIISEEQYRLNSGTARVENGINLAIEDIKDPFTGKLLGRRIKTSLPNPKKGIAEGAKLPDTIRYLAINPENMLPNFINVPTNDPDLIAKFRIEDAKSERKYQLELSRLYADTITTYNNTSLNLVRDVVKELDDREVPLYKRIPSSESLDTLIKAELLSKNIDLNYDFWLTPVKNTKRILYKKVSNMDADPLSDNTYSHVLFSNDVAIKDPGMIYLRLPNQNKLIFNTMFATLASSAGLLLVLLFIFAYTIYAIIRQKKLSEMKTDFINNMTHEFKTPVATIMIASEALKDPEVVADRTRLSRLANIIYDENVRLGNHIERVLSVARLEKKEIKLESNPVNINELIVAVVDSMSLQLNKKNAHTRLALDASESIIYGDELHLSNVFYNLIDNANKYSGGDPQITIRTRNNNRSLFIEVSDEGIGMTKDQTKRIFDQFYRVPTGNLHDVKGFGLGLNYVQDIVHEMDGSIKVHSEKDKGTTFEVCLPFNTSN